jgi:hypothetical protein
MNSEEELANFQAALLELLDTQQDLKDMRSQLQQNPAFAAFQEYLNTFDDKMLGVAAELVKKWARHNSYLDI